MIVEIKEKETGGSTPQQPATLSQPTQPAGNSQNTTSSQPKEQKEETVEPVMYTVARGDSLYKIARKHHMSLQMLCSLNPEIARQRYIFVGQHIRVK